MDKSTSQYFPQSDASWAVRLLLLLVFCLVAGGLLLDYLASAVPSPDFQDSMELRTDPKTKEEIRISKGTIATGDRTVLVELAKTKAQRLNESARLLYDFAKISLGALIALVTQLVATQRRGPNEKGSQGTERESPDSKP